MKLFSRGLGFLLILVSVMLILSGCGKSNNNPLPIGDDEDGITADLLVQEGEDFFSNLDFDAARNSFTNAVITDPNNQVAKAWLSFLNLGDIMISPEYVDLMKNRFGFYEYPDSWEYLLSEITEYSSFEYHTEYYSIILPVIKSVIPNPSQKMQEFLSINSNGFLNTDSEVTDYMAVLYSNMLISTPDGINEVIDSMKNVLNGTNVTSQLNTIKSLTSANIGLNFQTLNSALENLNYDANMGTPPAVFPRIPVVSILNAMAAAMEFERGIVNYISAYDWNVNTNGWILNNADDFLLFIEGFETFHPETSPTFPEMTPALATAMLDNFPNPLVGPFLNARPGATAALSTSRNAFVSAIDFSLKTADLVVEEAINLRNQLNTPAMLEELNWDNSDIDNMNVFIGDLESNANLAKTELLLIRQSLNGGSPYLISIAQYPVEEGYEYLNIAFNALFDTPFFAFQNFLKKTGNNIDIWIITQNEDPDSSAMYDSGASYDTSGDTYYIAFSIDTSLLRSIFPEYSGEGGDAYHNLEEEFEYMFEMIDGNYFLPIPFSVEMILEMLPDNGTSGEPLFEDIHDIVAFVRGQ